MGRHLGAFPALGWDPVEFALPVECFGVLGLTRGGPERQPGVRRRAWLAAGNGGLAGGAVLPPEVDPSRLRRLILDERSGLDTPSGLSNWSTVDPRTRSTAPCQRVHCTRGTPRQPAAAVWRPVSSRNQPLVKAAHVLQFSPRIFK